VLLHTSASDELKSSPLALVKDDTTIQTLTALLKLDEALLAQGSAMVLLRNFSDSAVAAVSSSTTTTSVLDNALVLYHDDLAKLSEVSSSNGLVFNDVLIKNVKKWSDNNRWPKTMQWSKFNQPFIFTRRPGFETHILLLLPSSTALTSTSTSTSTSSELKLKFDSLADKYVPNALFLYCEHDGDGETSHLMSSLKVDPSNLPTSIVVRSCLFIVVQIIVYIYICVYIFIVFLYLHSHNNILCFVFCGTFYF
jgi:hypothetical protein